MRLEDDDEPAAVADEGLGGLDDRRDLAGVVGVVVDDDDSPRLALRLEPPSRAGEGREAGEDAVGVLAEPVDGRGIRGRGVERVVAARARRASSGADAGVAQR